MYLNEGLILRSGVDEVMRGCEGLNIIRNERAKLYARKYECVTEIVVSACESGN